MSGRYSRLRLRIRGHGSREWPIIRCEVPAYMQGAISRLYAGHWQACNDFRFVMLAPPPSRELTLAVSRSYNSSVLVAYEKRLSSKEVNIIGELIGKLQLGME